MQNKSGKSEGNAMEEAKQGAYWQSSRSLTQCVEHMFDEQLVTDVTFLLGEDKEAVCAHKFILISRSPVLYAMFEGPMSEKGEIVIPDITKDIFVAFIRYLYTDKTTLNVTNAIGILYTAKKYMVDRLTEACHKFLNRNERYACRFLEQSHVYGEEITSYCQRMLFGNSRKCLQFEFTELCQSCVLTLTASDELGVLEDEVYHTVMEWSEAECKRQNLDVAVSRRQVLGDVIYNIRFPVMETELLLTDVLSNNFLTAEEFTEIMKIQSKILDESLSKFTTSTRKIKYKSIQRFPRFCNTRQICLAPDTHAISFYVSNPMYFHGVEAYGNDTKSYGIQLCLDDPFEKHLGVKQQLLSLFTETTRIEFSVPIKLEAGKLYTIVLKFTKKCKTKTWIEGTEGKDRVSVNGVTVTFVNSSLDKSETSVQEGQIPALFLSPV